MADDAREGGEMMTNFVTSPLSPAIALILGLAYVVAGLIDIKNDEF